MGRFISYEKAVERFIERTDIALCQNDYNGWKRKSKFWDKIVCDFFWAIPANVYKLGSVHPKRRAEKRRHTCLNKYGVVNPMQFDQIKEKVKQTNLEKWGVSCTLQNKEIKRKIHQVNLEKLGTINPLSSKKIQKKIKRTMLERYGVEYPLQSDKFKYKIKKTKLRRYGNENYNNIKKAKETCLRQFGLENPSQKNEIKKEKKRKQAKYFLKGTNILMKDWLADRFFPKPSYSTVQQWAKQINKENKTDFILVSPYKLDVLCKNYKQNKTVLEVATEDLLEKKHYNKKPKIISKLYRPDFKLNDKIYLNVDGLYWHSELQKDKWYHFKLREEFEKSGLRIFQFREDEIRDKPQIVKSIANNSLGNIVSRIFARKCKFGIVKQKEAKTFLLDNHLMGSINAKHIGLYYNCKLVMILSWKCRKSVCKIERFCSKAGTNVIGGFSKLLSYLERNCLREQITEIHNWVDLRYGTGNHLKTKGFELKKETLGWRWTDGKNTFNRLRCRANMDDRNLSQQEYADELGWIKIYDAGQRLYVKKYTR